VVKATKIPVTHKYVCVAEVCVEVFYSFWHCSVKKSFANFMKLYLSMNSICIVLLHNLFLLWARVSCQSKLVSFITFHT